MSMVRKPLIERVEAVIGSEPMTCDEIAVVIRYTGPRATLVGVLRQGVTLGRVVAAGPTKGTFVRLGTKLEPKPAPANRQAARREHPDIQLARSGKYRCPACLQTADLKVELRQLRCRRP